MPRVLQGGAYVARMDADDVAHPERLARQVSFMNEHPEVGVLGTRTTFATSVQKSSGMRWFVDWQNAIRIRNGNRTHAIPPLPRTPLMFTVVIG